eukprot:7565534-Prorocentrum_lima.AAC.1
MGDAVDGKPACGVCAQRRLDLALLRKNKWTQRTCDKHSHAWLDVAWQRYMHALDTLAIAHPCRHFFRQVGINDTLQHC